MARDAHELLLRGLSGPIGSVLVMASLIVNVTLALTTRAMVDDFRPVAAALVLFVLVLPAVVLAPRRSAAVQLVGATAPAVMALLVSWQIPETSWPGYTSWHIGAGTFLLFCVALRGSILAAWVGFAGIAVITAVWTATTAQPASTWIDLLLPQAVSLVIATVVALEMHHVIGSTSQLLARRRARVSKTLAARAQDQERRRRLEELDDVAGDALRRLAEGWRPSPAETVELDLLERELRDRLRAEWLDVPDVVDAVRAARRRGVAVELMDDGGTARPDDRTAVLARLPELLGRVDSGQVVVRVMPPGRRAAVTLVHEDGDGGGRAEIAADGTTSVEGRWASAPRRSR